MFSAIRVARHMVQRRADLRCGVDYGRAFETWEESCVPSYCHSNLGAAFVSWLRLFLASDLARSSQPAARRALDFGASVGELGHLLGQGVAYDFIERNNAAALFLASRHPQATRHTLEGAPCGVYDWVFAIDALEHNENFAEIVGMLGDKLSGGGVLILSGPTENALYRLGRRIAGFSGAYHRATIYEIEQAASEKLTRERVGTIVPGLPLFRVSSWTKGRQKR